MAQRIYPIRLPDRVKIPLVFFSMACCRILQIPLSTYLALVFAVSTTLLGVHLNYSQRIQG